MNRGGPLRTCGKRYVTEASAWCSKRGSVEGASAVPCRDCLGWHVIPAGKPAATGAQSGRPYEGFPKEIRAAAIERDGGACIYSGETGLLEVHHRRIKGMGGDGRDHTDCLCNAATLVRRWHRWAHLTRREARAAGLIVPRSAVLPGATAVMVHGAGGGGSTLYPTCDGRWVSNAPSVVAA